MNSSSYATFSFLSLLSVKESVVEVAPSPNFHK